LASAHVFANDIQAVYQRAATQQLETMLSTNERMAELFAQLAANKEPERALSLQLEITTALSKAGLASVTAWTELAQQLTEKCSGIGAQTSAILLAKSEPATKR
jgi:hypothetical protein